MNKKRNGGTRNALTLRFGVLGIIMLISLVSVHSMVWGAGPPEFSISNPNVISDGSGGIVVAYHDSSSDSSGDDRITYIQRLDESGNALWEEGGIQLYSEQRNFLSNGERLGAALVSDDKGNFIAVWPSEHTLWAQKFNMEGHSLWQEGNVQLSSISAYNTDNQYSFKAVSDTSGGAIISWVGIDDGLYLQRITTEGNRLFDEEIWISDVQRFDLDCDDSGNAVLIWVDRKDNILFQKLNSSGQQAWASTNLLLSDIYGPGYPSEFINRIAVVDTESIIVIWVHKVLSEDKRLIIGQDLYAQGIDAEGEKLWGDGILVADSVRKPQVVRDGSGGAFVLWRDSNVVWAQRLDATGSPLWPENGIQVGQGEIPDYHLTYDGSGGIVIVWASGWNEGRKLYAQRIDGSGQKLWGGDGILVSNVSAYWASYSIPARISQGDSGGFIITWAAGEHIKDTTSSYIQKISAEGEIMWGEDGIRIDTG